jgi:hypothetical protein
MRASASPSAVETNITVRMTANASYDVKDVDSSADGTKVVFAMRGPLTPKMKQKDPPSWRIYEYVIKTNTLHPVIDPTTDPDPATVNDVSPHYLPDGRILFSSTRQTQSKAVLLDESACTTDPMTTTKVSCQGKPQFEAQDEARTEPAFVLHVVNADGTGLHQISFNQSHDRDATVLSTGRLLWSRWDHAPGKDAMHLYSSNPDGTDLQLYYGANSHLTGTNNTTIEFVRPREMQDGRILTLVRQYADTSDTQKIDFGGDLVIIDGNKYVENGQPTLANAGLTGPAQTRATPNDVRTIPGPSPGGRFNSAYPLWDGTSRILVSWTQCRLLDPTGAIVPCTNAHDADPTYKTAPPLYSVWMFNPTDNTILPVMQPVEGVMVTDIVSTQPRTLQNIVLDKLPGVDLNQDLVNAQVGVIDIKSVYDFDGVATGFNGAPVDIRALSDGKTPAAQRQARFLRLEKPVSIPSQDVLKLADAAFGATPYMREILGYVPIEPDGSVRVTVPANVAFQMSVLDANGRRISPIQGSWLQVKAGEVVTCNGCHKPATQQSPLSHGRVGLFAAAYTGATTAGAPFPDSVATFPTGESALPQAGETMAETHARATCAQFARSPATCSMTPSTDIKYTDVWTDKTVAGAATNPDIHYLYSGGTNGLTSPELAPTGNNCLGSSWMASCRIVINYQQVIQPIWDLPRASIKVAGTTVNNVACSSAGCHNTTDAAGKNQVPAAQLDLTNTPSNEEQLQFVSYRDLLFTHNQLELMMGALTPVPGPPDANGNPTVVTVGGFVDAGSANGGASQAFLGTFATGGKHEGGLTSAELRLISEWLDIGAQYFNNPFDRDAPLN